MKKTASDSVLALIRKKLMSGEWKQGSKIATEMQLAQEAGVSRASAREAIEKLSAMGILVRRQGDGTYVDDLSPKILFNQLLPDFLLNKYDIGEILDFREMLEPIAIKRLTDNYDKQRINNMHDFTQIMSQHANERESEEFAQADLQFHMSILTGSGNSILSKVVEIIEDSLIFYQFEANKVIGPKTGVQEHLDILRAVEAHDSELASLLIKRHIQRSKRDIMQDLINFSD